jgi:hypothetical protein
LATKGPLEVGNTLFVRLGLIRTFNNPLGGFFRPILANKPNFFVLNNKIKSITKQSDGPNHNFIIVQSIACKVAPCLLDLQVNTRADQDVHIDKRSVQHVG